MTRAAVIVPIDALPDGVQLLDVRWTLGGSPGAGRAAYLAGHLPGARFLDLEAVPTMPGEPGQGRHPLPDAARLEAGLGALGVEASRPIVVYDEPGSFAAGRAWWVLTWAGLDVRVLDGGLPAWVASGRPLVAGDVAVTPTVLTLTTGHLPTIDADEAASWPGTLIDARVAERFTGATEPVDPVAGHIPGAVNRPVTGFWTPEGTLPDDATLRDRLGSAREPIAVYCGSGVSAAQVILALTALDVPAALYPPSWSGWCADPAHDVATGPGKEDR